MATIDIEVDGKVEKIPLLGSDGKIPNEFIPKAILDIVNSGGSSGPRVTSLEDMTSSRTNNTWYANTTAYDINVNLLVNTVAGATASFFDIQQGTVGTIMTVESNRVATNIVASQEFALTIPSGWRYRVRLATNRSVNKWFEVRRA